MYDDYKVVYESNINEYLILWIVLGIILLILLLIVLVSISKVLKKANRSPLTGFIPIYNLIPLLEITNMSKSLFVPLIIPIVNIPFLLMLDLELAKLFKKDKKFGILLLVLPFIFFPILAFGKSEYIGINLVAMSGKNTIKDIPIIDDEKNEQIEKVDNKYFHFIHLEGAHVPFGTCKDFTSSNKCGYSDKLQASIVLIKSYLDRLKKYDVYDNAAIMVMSDHGYVIGNKNGAYGRTNPILFIKGVDEHHDMLRSTKPVSYTDLDNAYVDLLDGKKSYELFDGIEYPRERIIMWYKYTKENHMVEYVQTGKAWDEKTLKKTGKEYNR